MTPGKIIKTMDELSEGVKRKHHDCVTMSQVVPQAAALIREMREMLRVIEQGASECMVCKTNLNQYENHAPDCKIAQMLKD